MNYHRKLLAVLIFLFANLFSSLAQDSTRCLIIEKLENRKVDSAYGIMTIKQGDEIMVRTTNDVHPTKGSITNITDTSIVLDHTNMILIYQITEITWEQINPNSKKNNGAIVIGGIAALVFAVIVARNGSIRSLGAAYVLIGVALAAIVSVGVTATKSGKHGGHIEKRQFLGHWKMSSVPISVANNYRKKRLS